MELKLYNTTSSKLNSLNIVGGQLIVSKDNSCLYIDIDSIGRLKITDWIELETDNDRLAVLAPISGKIYYVSETNAIWKYVKGSWKCLNEVNKEEIFEYVIENLQSYLDAKVSTSRKINGKALTSDITLSASDVGATTQGYVDNQISALGNTYYTENEIDEKIDDINDAIDKKSDSEHNHDDKYYTETEIDNKISELNTVINKKSDNTHNHNDDYSVIDHKHTVSEITDIGSHYYNQTQIDSKISTINNNIENKSDIGHGHSIAEITNLQTFLNDKVSVSRKINNKSLTADITITASDIGALSSSDITIIKNDVNSYTDQKIANLLNNSTEAVDSIFELRDAMEDNADAISALESIAAGHALKDHTHNYAGSSSVGGSANSAVKLDSSAGSATQPVFFETGKPKATTYALNATVPADAKFTDTVYTHPSHTAKSSGFYKVTVDAQGHVSGATAVTKSDITGLGIPAQDTTYGDATESKSGLMSASDKAKLNDIEILVWAGTQAEYNALSDADKEDTLCIITDSTESVNFETVANKVTAISASSTDQQYASARAIWNLVQNISGYIKSTDKSTVISNTSTDNTIPSSKAVYTHTNNTVNSIKNEILTTLENRVYGVEKTTNKVTEITEDAKHTTYPSAKAVWDLISQYMDKNEDEEEKIETVTEITENSTHEEVPSAKAVHDFVVNYTPELPDTIPTVYTGTSEPNASLGKAGDIYFIIE